jgi:DNA-binding protein
MASQQMAILAKGRQIGDAADAAKCIRHPFRNVDQKRTVGAVEP